MRRFAMPWDRTLRFSTAVVTVALLGVGVAVGVAAREGIGEEGAWGWVAYAPGVVVFAVFLAVWALAPRAIELGAGRLVVVRALSPIVIRLAEVTEVELMGPKPLRGALRTGGAAGLFGHYGRFWSRQLGHFRLYATRGDGLVRVDAAGGRFVLSPESPERFVETLLAQAPSARRAGAAAAPIKGGVVRHLWPVLAAVALVPISLGAILGGSWALAPKAIYAGDGAVVVERNWAETVVIPTAPPVRVWRVPPRQVGRVRRTGGVALGDLRYGRWHSTTLGSFQLYSHRWGPLFAIDGPEGRIIVIPDDPDAFAEATGAEQP